MVAVIVVALTTVTPITVRPFAGGATCTDVPVVVKPVPVSVTAVGVPRRPELGVIEARVGVPGLTTANVSGLLSPPAVLTVTFLAVSAAVAEIANVAVIVLSFTTVKPLTVMPPPFTLIPVEPVRPVPVRVTGTLLLPVLPLAPVVGEIEVSEPGGTITVNVTALLVPAIDVVVTFLAPADALREIASVAVTEVSLTTVRPLTVMPPPDTLIAVVPVNPLPVSVIGTVPSRLPEAGAIEVSTGPLMANGRVLLAPPAVITPILTAPTGAVVLLLKVAVMVVGFWTTTLLMLKPDTAGVATTVDPVTKFVPVRVTSVEMPRNSELGAMDVNVGAAGAMTVKVTALLVPAGVVTVTFLAVNVAFGAMVKVAVTVVPLTAAKLLTLIPPPLTFTAVAPVRKVPVIVTLTPVP